MMNRTFARAATAAVALLSLATIATHAHAPATVAKTGESTLSAMAPALGPLWGYVDGSGTAHFAKTQLDSHYSPVLGDGPAAHVPGKKDGPANLLTWLEFAPDALAVQPLLKEAGAHAGVDPDLLKAVIAVESHFNPKAISHAGALGLMQLTPETADRYATPSERETPAKHRMLDPRTNIFTGARMLADLTRRYGSIDVALAAWNAGEGTVRKAGGRVPDIPETEAHVHMVLELYWALLQRSMSVASLKLQMHDPR